MLGNATAMGWTPSEFWRASFTDYIDAVQGWNEAHGQKTVKREDVAAARAKMRAANERAERRSKHGDAH